MFVSPKPKTHHYLIDNLFFKIELNCENTHRIQEEQLNYGWRGQKKKSERNNIVIPYESEVSEKLKAGFF